MATAASSTAFLLVLVVLSSQRNLETSRLDGSLHGPRIDLIAPKFDQSALPDVQYFYLPAAALPKSAAVEPVHIPTPPVYYMSAMQSLAANSTNGTNSTFRSCGIASLVAQARAVFPQWDACGYRSSASTFHLGSSRGVVTGPSDDTLCGPDNIWLWPCVEKYQRTFENDNPSKLASCFDRIHDLSLTCKYYDVCGGHTLESTGKTSVCTSPEGDYYKEPDVQRMCGICSMYRAESRSHWLRQHPEEEEEDDDEVDGGGCFASDGYLTVRDETAGEAGALRRVRDVAAGDMVKAGSGGFRRVYYTLSHEAPKTLVTVRWGNNVEAGGSFTLTPTHTIPLYAEACGEEYCEAAPLIAATAIRVGHRVYVASRGGSYKATTVTAVERSRGEATYVLVEGGVVELSGRGGNGLVGGLVSVYSSSLGPLETLPFLFLHRMLPGLLQTPAVSKTLQAALESPAVAFLGRLLPPALPPSPPRQPSGPHAVVSVESLF